MKSPIKAEQIVVDDSVESCRRKIVVTMDESATCENALSWCLKNIIQPNDALILINVQSKASIFSRPPDIDVSELILTIEERVRADSHQLLTDAVSKARAHLPPNMKIQAISLKGDDPREVLLQEIEALNADCVVMGSRGLSKVKGVVFGSVSTFLMRHVRVCPVIVIKF
ncbi:hypothetical protein BDR26DRAFT_851812 [Obelidium mucronatum]|nr:hypothetical protein BDR26DRAFT_851812 [Obelidium mucronatum]